ncbi:kv channel-interacting protein 4 [Caerostris darwini]|uniref:Kv channel-interacting protein 4 n=1 Tax=Caerostris darwini TaxID=1538125 RepID=A0AAV4S3R7_9ARAC|nr:kv channel-interacting protein 4 [Caerostris darwini]
MHQQYSQSNSLLHFRFIAPNVAYKADKPICSQSDFIQCLSLMCRGTIQEKLQWAFKLYDLNGDGRITKKELTDIVCSVYALVGRKSFSGAEEKALREHVDKTFLKMDINKDGVVTMDEFMEICSKDETIAQSLTLFDTVL